MTSLTGRKTTQLSWNPDGWLWGMKRNFFLATSRPSFSWLGCEYPSIVSFCSFVLDVSPNWGKTQAHPVMTCLDENKPISKISAVVSRNSLLYWGNIIIIYWGNMFTRHQRIHFCVHDYISPEEGILDAAYVIYYCLCLPCDLSQHIISPLFPNWKPH